MQYNMHSVHEPNKIYWLILFPFFFLYSTATIILCHSPSPHKHTFFSTKKTTISMLHLKFFVNYKTLILYIMDRPCFLFRHPTERIRNIFLQPFSNHVWWCILICGIFTILTYSKIAVEEQQIDQESSNGKSANIFCFIFKYILNGSYLCGYKSKY